MRGLGFQHSVVAPCLTDKVIYRFKVVAVFCKFPISPVPFQLVYLEYQVYLEDKKYLLNCIILFE